MSQTILEALKSLIDTDIKPLQDKFKELNETITENTKKAGEEIGKLKEAFQGIGELADMTPLGDLFDFSSLSEGIDEFTNGILEQFGLTNEQVQEFTASFGDVITKVMEIGAALASVDFAVIIDSFTKLSGVFSGISLPVIAIVAGIALLAAAMLHLWETSEVFRGSVMTMVEGIQSIITRLWNEVLVPLGAFLMDIYHTVLEPLAAFLWEVLCVAVEKVFVVLESLWNNILGPIANFLVDVLVVALQTVQEIWESWKPIIEDLFEKLQEFWDTMLKPFVDFLVEEVCKILEDVGEVVERVIGDAQGFFAGLSEYLVGIFTGDWEKVWSGIETMLTNFGSFLTNIFGIDFNSAFKVITDTVLSFKEEFGQVFEGMQKTLGGIITFIQGVFTGDWEMVWDGIKQIFEGLWTSMKGVINSIIQGVENMANVVVGGINMVIKALNRLSFDIPDFMGGGSFGFDIALLKEVRFDRLADGGLVRSGQLFLAREAGPELVGSYQGKSAVMNNDQIVKSVSNGVALAMMDVMSGANKESGDSSPIQVNLVVDGRTLAKVLADTKKRSGYSFGRA